MILLIWGAWALLLLIYCCLLGWNWDYLSDGWRSMLRPSTLAYTKEEWADAMRFWSALTQQFLAKRKVRNLCISLFVFFGFVLMISIPFIILLPEILNPF